MTDHGLIWRIAGGSGDGITSTNQNFAKALMRTELYVFTYRHYPSRIRGSHTYTEVCVSADLARSRGDGYNFLLAFGDSFTRNPSEGVYHGDEEIKPLSESLDELDEGDVIVYNSGLLDAFEIEDFDERVEENDWHVYDIDLRTIAREYGREVMCNTAGVAITCAIAGIEPNVIKSLMSDAMSDKILEPNLTVLNDAYEMVQEEHDVEAPDVSVPTGEHDEEQVLLSGSGAIAYGAIDEGCRFIADYPMTPWMEVFTIMTQNLSELGDISEQVENEITTAALVVGVSHTGVKAMSGSSGGGFSLMFELLGPAEITETPLVLAEAMRAGPSTGTLTKPEQSDFEHVLYTPQGDSHCIVFAPGNAAEVYYQTCRAFQIAHEYRIPSIVLYNWKLGDEFSNVPASVSDEEPNADLGLVLTEAELGNALHNDFGKYQRLQHDTKNDVLPWLLPGQKGSRYLVTGNEHIPVGHILELPENHVVQMNRRIQKVDSIRAEFDTDGEFNTVHGDEDADLGLITSGSQQGTVEEAANVFNEKSHSVKVLGVSEMMPFPKQEVADLPDSADEALVVEMTASAQFRGLISKELGGYGGQMPSLLKYNGNPFEPADIIEGFETALLEGEGLPDNRMKFVPKVGE